MSSLVCGAQTNGCRRISTKPRLPLWRRSGPRRYPAPKPSLALSALVYANQLANRIECDSKRPAPSFPSLPDTCSLGRFLPVVSHRLLTLAIRPDSVLTVEGRSASDLPFRDVRVIAFKLSVIGEHLPRDREMMDPDAHQA